MWYIWGVSTSPTFEFRGSRRTAIVGTVSCGVMLALWGIPFYRHPENGVVFLLPIIAGVFIIFAWVVFGILAQRVIVSAAGVSIRQSLVYSTKFLWGDLARWNIAEVHTRTITRRQLQFHSRSTGCIHRIDDNGAWKPKFDDLIASIRHFAPERESELIRVTYTDRSSD